MQRNSKLAAATAALVLLSACNASGSPSTAVPSPSPASTPTVEPTRSATLTPAPSGQASDNPLLARTQAEFAVPGGPDLPVAAFGSMWILTPDGDVPSVTRVDPATNEILAVIPTGSRLCQAIGATDDAIWACVPDGVMRIDPRTNQAGPVVEFDLAATLFFGYLPSGGGSLWALGGDAVAHDRVMRIDPTANVVTETYELDFDAAWISFGEDALWITDPGGSSLWRLDPASGDVSLHIDELPGPGSSSVAAGSVWLSVQAGGDYRPTAADVTLLRIDPDAGHVEAAIALGGTIGESHVSATDDAVWVRTMDPFLVHVDPQSNGIVESFHDNALGGSVAVAYDSVWATSYRLNRVWRIEP